PLDGGSVLYLTFASRLVTCWRLSARAVFSVQPAVRIAVATATFDGSPSLVTRITPITTPSATTPDAANSMSSLSLRWSSGDLACVDERRCGAWTGRRVGGGGVRGFLATACQTSSEGPGPAGS